MSYLVKTELPDGRMSIIVDPGAWTNLAGGNWIRNMTDRALKNGITPAQTKLQKPFEVQGVGQGTQQAIWNVHMPIAVKNQDGEHVKNTFEVPALEGQDGASVPALLGMRSMRRKKAVLQMEAGKEMLTFHGDGGYTIEWSPGTVHIPLSIAPSGHYAIPCYQFGQIKTQTGGLVSKNFKTVLHSMADQTDDEDEQQSRPSTASSSTSRKM